MKQTAFKYRETGGIQNSFSSCHTLPYAAIALQEMNLYHFYPHIYWQTAVLTINAGANESNDDNGATNYGKIAKAIGDMKHQGVQVALPEITSASFGFKPDATSDRIIFGLKGMVGIGDEAAQQVVANRSYNSLADFYQKNMNLGNVALLALVKGGCFDCFGLTRQQAAQQMLDCIAFAKVEPKGALTFQNFPAMKAMPGFIPSQMDFQVSLVSFRSYIFKKEFLFSNKPKAYKLDDYAARFFENEAIHCFTEGLEYDYQGADFIIYQAKFEKRYKELIQELTEWMQQPETLSAFNQRLNDAFCGDLRDKYLKGCTAKWEMDSLSFYYTEHELSHANLAQYNVSSFSSIPEEPIVLAVKERKDRKTGVVSTWNQYQLFRIAGTVLDRDNTKHTISLLTLEGVVTVKFFAGNFAHYNKQISEKLPGQDKKTVIEKSWFARGTKLLITGIRRSDNFVPKKYSDSVYNHTVCLIEEVLPDGSLQLKLDRERTDD